MFSTSILPMITDILDRRRLLSAWLGRKASIGISTALISVVHLRKRQVCYANMPIQYTAIFHSCRKDNFQMKNCDFFLTFALNIDCGYMLEPPH